MRNRPAPQEIYRHFKGKLYQILAVAKHSETGEELVIYQAMYDDFSIYARPLLRFMEEVDHVKYPDVTQKYRFEAVAKIGEPMARETLPVEQQAAPIAEQQTPSTTEQLAKPTVEQTAAPAAEQSVKPVVEAPTDNSDNQEDGYIDPRVIEFLDARTYEEKLRILSAMRETITNDMINTMAAAEDIEVKPGSVEDRYEEFKNCLVTLDHFEVSRLRY